MEEVETGWKQKGVKDRRGRTHKENLQPKLRVDVGVNSKSERGRRRLEAETIRANEVASIGKIVDRATLGLQKNEGDACSLFSCSYIEPNATNASLGTGGDFRRGWRKHNDDDDDADDDGEDDDDAEFSSRKFLSRRAGERA